MISRATLLRDLVDKLAQMTSNPPHKCYLTIDIAGEGDWRIVYGGDEKERETNSVTVDEVGMVEGIFMNGDNLFIFQTHIFFALQILMLIRLS